MQQRPQPPNQASGPLRNDADAEEFPRSATILQSDIEVAATLVRAFIEGEEKLTLSESRDAFVSLADSIPQFVWICTPDGANIYFNQRWVNYTGLSLDESYGAGWNTPFHPED